jgi:replicative DNA helicase
VKTIAKSKPRALRRGAFRVLPAAAKLTDEEFRRQLHLELADEITAARASFAKTHGHLLRPRTPREIEARFARWRATLEEARKNPISRQESESYDRMLARIVAERAEGPA